MYYNGVCTDGASGANTGLYEIYAKSDFTEEPW
jgi:hypothetical protein